MVTASEILGALTADADEVLEAIAAASLVLNKSDEVIRATTGAVSFGLVKNGELVHKALRKLVKKARASRQVEVAELSLKTGLQQQDAFVHVRVAPLKHKRILMLVEDRTEFKKLEDTRRDFVANISHELKTPIGAISLLAEALTEAKDDAELVTKFSGNLVREASRLNYLVQDIIQLSQVQAAESATTFNLISLKDVINDAITQNQVVADQRGVKISTKASKHSKAYGNYDSLVTALKNLIQNAILYSAPGGEVKVVLSRKKDLFEIAVVDRGVGISPENLDRVFERFFRVDQSRSRETGGTGLGLAIVKHVAQNHPGEVTVSSELGKGTTFTLRLPRPELEFGAES